MLWGLDDRDPALLSGLGVPCTGAKPPSWRAQACWDVVLPDVTHWWQGFVSPPHL